MINKIHSIRSNHLVSIILASFVSLNGTLGIILQIIRAFNFENRTAALATTFVYFTTQSNSLVILIPLLFILGFNDKKWFKILAFITLINITMTSIIFHVLITPFMSSVGMMQHILHTTNPVLFIIFYFVIITDFVPLKKVWVGLIYPLIYILFVYLIAEPILGDLLELASPSFQSARYVYPFLDPNQYQHGILGLLVFNFGIIAPLILLFTLFLAHLKKKFESNLA